MDLVPLEGSLIRKAGRENVELIVIRVDVLPIVFIGDFSALEILKDAFEIYGPLVAVFKLDFVHVRKDYDLIISKMVVLVTSNAIVVVISDGIMGFTDVGKELVQHRV